MSARRRPVGEIDRTHWFAYDDAGQVLMTGHCPRAEVDLQRRGLPAGLHLRVVCARFGLPRIIDDWFDRRTGTLRERPPCPDQHHQWCWQRHAWHDPRAPEQVLAQQWADVRRERDARLAATDWRLSVAQERGQPLASEWRVYRQALRDITEQPDPTAIEWPTPPTHAQEPRDASATA